MGKRPPKKVTENDVKRDIKRAFDICGVWSFHLMAGMGSFKGAPDRIAVYRERVWAVEAKRPGGKQSEHQAEFQRRWEREYGKTYILADNAQIVLERMGLVKT